MKEEAMSTLEYTLRLVIVALSTCVRGVVFLMHRLVSGTSSITYPHVQSWCRNVLALSGVRVRAEGAENLDPGASYIYVANHASLFDIPALQVALPGSVRIMYKKELQKIPFMGWALRYSSFIPIVREKARDAMNTVNATVDIIRNDASSLMIFPEGTRTPDGSVQKFKRGAFIVALQSGKPLVPVAICGSFDVLPKHTLRFRKGEIVVRMGTPIVPEDRAYSREEEIALMNTMHATVAKLLNRK
jgi:1-acyl-sn-glycerol-3-phosphate acyltransferase